MFSFLSHFLSQGPSASEAQLTSHILSAAPGKFSPTREGPVMALVGTPEYKALEAHAKQLKEQEMRDMFEQNPKRFEEFR